MIAPLNKFRRIKSKLSGSADEAVEVQYSVRCDCGHKVTGIRRTSWIEAECQNCYQSVFVLPVNCYPSTERVPSEVLGGTFRERLTAVIGEFVPGKKTDSGKSTTSDRDAGQTRKAARKTKKDAETGTVVTAEAKRRFVMPRIDLAGMLRRTFTPFRLLMLAMVSVLSLTAYWMVIQSRTESAKQTWLTAKEEASEQLQSGDMIALEAQLRMAVDAGYMLGKSDEEWRDTLNLFLETIAINNLASTNLLNAFHDIYLEGNQLASDAESRMKAVLQEGFFVIDSTLIPVEGEIFLVEFPATPGVDSVKMYLPFPELKDLSNSAIQNRVLFAARFSDVKPPDQNGGWHLLVDVENFALMTSTLHCETIGLLSEDDPQLDELLDLQQEFVINNYRWEQRQINARIPSVFQPTTGEQE